MKILGRCGDVNAAEFGGGVLFRDEGDVWLLYTHGLEEAHPNYQEDDDYEDIEIEVYRVGVPTGASLLEWYDWVDVDKVEASFDMDEGELRGLAAGNLLKRAMFLEVMGIYFGWTELDQYPTQMPVGELQDKYGM